jgi:hypothetical protein
MPSKHVFPPVQALPQAPQCWLLQQVSMQTPSHSACPSAQVLPAAHWPPSQMTLTQALSQAPQ